MNHYALLCKKCSALVLVSIRPLTLVLGAPLRSQDWRRATSTDALTAGSSALHPCACGEWNSLYNRKYIHPIKFIAPHPWPSVDHKPSFFYGRHLCRHYGARPEQIKIRSQ